LLYSPSISIRLVINNKAQGTPFSIPEEEEKDWNTETWNFAENFGRRGKRNHFITSETKMRNGQKFRVWCHFNLSRVIDSVLMDKYFLNY